MGNLKHPLGPSHVVVSETYKNLVYRAVSNLRSRLNVRAKSEYQFMKMTIPEDVIAATSAKEPTPADKEQIFGALRDRMGSLSVHGQRSLASILRHLAGMSLQELEGLIDLYERHQGDDQTPTPSSASIVQSPKAATTPKDHSI